MTDTIAWYLPVQTGPSAAKPALQMHLYDPSELMHLDCTEGHISLLCSHSSISEDRVVEIAWQK
jgi:hypothetical protein